MRAARAGSHRFPSVSRNSTARRAVQCATWGAWGCRQAAVARTLVSRVLHSLGLLGNAHARLLRERQERQLPGLQRQEDGLADEVGLRPGSIRRVDGHGAHIHAVREPVVEQQGCADIADACPVQARAGVLQRRIKHGHQCICALCLRRKRGAIKHRRCEYCACALRTRLSGLVSENVCTLATSESMEAANAVCTRRQGRSRICAHASR